MNTKEIYLSLGGNQGDSLEYLLQAVIALSEKGITIKKLSSIYQTEPVGYIDQPDFLNMAVQGETQLEPIELLRCCQAVESELKRVRVQRWGPRTIDIDILFYGTEQIRQDELTVPHPRLRERAFVLVPLKEISPEKFAELGVVIPEQKISLLIHKNNVKMMLKMRGLTL